MSNGAIGLVTLMRMSEAEARAFLEGMRWPNGATCPHCGVVGEATRLEKHTAESEAREGLWQCNGCRQQFTVTVGTVMEGSHIPLAKWLAAIHIICSSKKSVSALQIQRQLELGSYRTAWHLCHRIRLMLANGGPKSPLTGDVEADEVYLGGKPRHKLTKTAAALKRAERKIPVAVLVSRDGEARARAVEKVSAKELDAFVCGNTDVANSRLLTDELLIYRTIGKKFGKGHKAVNHLNREYARGDAHNNSCESFNSLLKRAYHGAWHHISREHVARYLSEQTFRWTNRKTSDWERTQKALGQMNGVRLYYKQPRRRDQQDGDSLVASA